MGKMTNDFYSAYNWIISLIDNLIISKILPVFISIIFFFIIYDRAKNPQKIDANYDSLCIGNRRKSSGIIFGKHNANTVIYSPFYDEGHIIVMGGSGLGKTSALLIPTLQSWNGTSFTIDISGDICKNVDLENKMVYQPSNPCTTPYNIFASIDNVKDMDDKNEMLERLAYLFMPDDPLMSDTSKFYTTEGRKILTASLIAFYHQGMDFIPICEKIVNSSWMDLFREIDASQNDKAIRYINSFSGASEQNTAGCKQSVDSVLKLFATNERVKKTIRRPSAYDTLSFSPEALEKYNVFVIIEDAKLNVYAPLLNIITSQCLDYFKERPIKKDTPVILFSLDEFASFGRLEITDAIRKLRKQKVRIMTLTQSIADVDLIYGKAERASMMNNYKFKVLLGAEDPETQEYFAKMIGYKDTKKHSESKNAQSHTFTESEDKEWIIEPAKLARLDAEDKSLILVCNGQYLRLKKNYYFK